MSVYIKGMEMPVDCLSCRVACDKENYGVIGRPPKCPLAEAPVGDSIGRAETIEAVELMEIFLGERKKNAVIRGIQTLPSAETAQEWIPCSERLPDVDVEVLATTDWSDVQIVWLTKGGAWETDEYILDHDEITAWMPLPKPYKGGGSE